MLPRSPSIYFNHRVDILSHPIAIGRYVDVSTVDAATSNLVSARIKDTGALFLEVG